MGMMVSDQLSVIKSVDWFILTISLLKKEITSIALEILRESLRRDHQQNERQTRHLGFPLAADKARTNIDNSLQERPAVQ
jgi:hypothetical protein